MGHKPDQKARKRRRERAATQAQKSARASERVRATRQRQERARRKKDDKAAAAQDRRIEAAAKLLAPTFYRGYRSEIAKAEKAGQRELVTDEESWSGDYYGDEPKADPKAVRQQRIKDAARVQARKMLEADDYKVEAKSESGNTSWGAGSDPYPTAGWSKSWIVISW